MVTTQFRHKVSQLQGWISLIEIGHSGLLHNDGERGDMVPFFLPMGKDGCRYQKEQKKLYNTVKLCHNNIKNIQFSS